MVVSHCFEFGDETATICTHQSARVCAIDSKQLDWRLAVGRCCVSSDRGRDECRSHGGGSLGHGGPQCLCSDHGLLSNGEVRSQAIMRTCSRARSELLDVSVILPSFDKVPKYPPAWHEFLNPFIDVQLCILLTSHTVELSSTIHSIGALLKKSETGLMSEAPCYHALMLQNIVVRRTHSTIRALF